MKRWTLRRWKKWVAAAVLAVGSTGCTKQLYMTPETQHLAASVGLPADLATNPNVGAASDTSDHKAPATVLDSTRELRYVTLQEAFALALERGTVGSQFLGSLGGLGAGSQRGGTFQDDLATSIRPGGGGDDSIRAFALDPAIVEADIEGALSKFDARFVTSMNWQKRDTQVANVFNNLNNGDFATFSSGLIKPLPTGGVTGITFDTNYTKLGATGGFQVINPSYQPALTFRFEQPLLQSSGIDINQLLPQHPGSTSIPNYRSSGGRQEGILVTRLRADQAKHQFEREVNLLLINVESTYWQMYANYFAKYAAETVLRLAYGTYADVQQLEIAGILAKQDVAQSRAQLESVRANYLNALQQVVESERQLRGLLGMPLEDGKRLVPADSPTLAPYKPDWNGALAEALNNRPELTAARQELKVQQLNVMLAQNSTRPDLRLFGNYNLNANGTRLDGPGPQSVVDPITGAVNQRPANALASLADDRFNSWEIGIRFEVPIGNRDAHAQLRVAQLNLARTHISLVSQERKAEFLLGSVYQQIFQAYEQIKIQRARRIALGTQLEGLFDRVKIGKSNLLTLFDAQRGFADAIQAEHQAIANYNIAIAGFQYAKGSLQQYNNVTIGDGPLPNAVAERAADHFGAKSAAIALRQRPGAVALPQDMETPIALPGLVESGPLPEIMNGVKPSPAAPPATPMTIPAGPAPKEIKPVSLNSPGMLPGLPAGPAMSPPDAPFTLPSTPVSRFRPQ